MADDPAQLEPEQGARRVEIEDDDGLVLQLHLLEGQVQARQQERRGIPAGRAVDLERDVARGLEAQRFRRRSAERDHLAAGVDDERGRVAPVDDALHHGQPVQADGQPVRRWSTVGHGLGHRQHPIAVVDGHRVPERDRVESFGLARGQPGERRVLDQRRHPAHVERPDLQAVETPDQQPAHPDAADAGTERHDVGADAEAIGHGLGDDGHLRPRVEHHVDVTVAVDAASHDDLVPVDAERDPVHLRGAAARVLQRLVVAEGAHEAHLLARPDGDVAVVLERQQVDVCRERRRRVLVAPQPLVRVHQRRVHVRLLGRRVQGSERRLEPLVQLAAREHALGEAAAGTWQRRRQGDRLLVARLGLVELSGRPHRIALEGQHLGVPPGDGHDIRGDVAGATELGGAQQRLHPLLPHAGLQRRRRQVEGPLVDLRGVGEPPVVEQQVTELGLDDGRGGVVPGRPDRRGSDQDRGGGHGRDRSPRTADGHVRTPPSSSPRIPLVDTPAFAGDIPASAGARLEDTRPLAGAMHHGLSGPGSGRGEARQRL